ncbi:MAG TPA: hypothetical protein VL461_03390 [Dictyobacter sp.]|nr:hypothetical protein [Dictyobacter sp.]
MDSASVSAQNHQDGVVTLVLTADNHLGYSGFGQHPRKREERLQLLRHAFQQASDFAIAQGVDFFIQAGDLFDTTNPDERDRSFVASRLAQLKQAGVRTFALGGVCDTPVPGISLPGEIPPAPQLSYARLGALHYFSPVLEDKTQQIEPVIVDVRGTQVGICGLGVLTGQEGDPLADVRVQLDIERAAIPILILHAPVEGVSAGSSLLDMRAQVARQSISDQSLFRFILAGYHHGHHRARIGSTDLIVAGATQYVDFSTPDQEPGFVFLGLAADGVRWCNHIRVDALSMQRVVFDADELWPGHGSIAPTEMILERLRPLCQPDGMIQLRLEGKISRSAYHQLDLNQIRHYGEEHCFALAIDDSALLLQSDQDVTSSGADERYSIREELRVLADEWITATPDEDKKQSLRYTKDAILSALDDIKSIL